MKRSKTETLIQKIAHLVCGECNRRSLSVDYDGFSSPCHDCEDRPYLDDMTGRLRKSVEVELEVRKLLQAFSKASKLPSHVDGEILHNAWAPFHRAEHRLKELLEGKKRRER